jgi:flagellar hook-associated protein 1 FlgK
MSGLIGAMNTALSGIEAFEAGINTVSENLTNAATPGYAVETVNLSTAVANANQPGTGVETPQIARAADGFVAGVLRTANSAGAAATVMSTSLSNISNALQDDGDVQSAMNQFFTDVAALAADPTSGGAQQTVLSDAQNVAGSFQSAAGSITQTMTGAVTALGQNVTAANNLLGQLKIINQDLQASPNDPTLEDQQEAALNSLASLLPVNVLPQSDGAVIVASGGTVLLDQSGVKSLSLTGGTGAEPPSITAGAADTAVTLTATDGQIGANIASWNAGAAANQSLGTLASVFAANVNTSQAEGLTSAGAPGAALFAVPSPSVAPAAGNTGTASLTAQITNAGQVPTDGGPFTLSYSAANGWSATDQASGTLYPVTVNGGTLAFAGMTLNVSGAPASGDQFAVNPAPGAAAAISVAATNPDQIAAADPYVASPGTLQANGSVVDNNAGQLTAGNDTVTSTPAAGAAVVPANYYGQTLQITFTSSSAYNVETTANPPTVVASGSLSGGNGTIAVAYPAGAASGNYWQLPISGTPAAGDTLTLQPGGPSSGSNATRMAAIWTSPGTSSQGTLQTAAVGLNTSLGANAQEAATLATSSASQVTAATTSLQTISGVSPDQQAVLLANYQQSYQAAAQVIAAANTMFNSLLSAVQ